VNRQDDHEAEPSHCELKTPRRRFSAGEKLCILEEPDPCTEPGEIGGQGWLCRQPAGATPAASREPANTHAEGLRSSRGVRTPKPFSPGRP